MDIAIPLSKNKSLHSYVYTWIFFSIATALTLTISYYKLLTLYSWLYSGHVFLADQILTETLKGNFGLEFAFGKFGCHYYFFFLFLLPFKIILAEKMVFMLILLPIFFYFATASILFFSIRSLTKNVQLSFLCALIFLFAPHILGGLYSYYHGTSPADDLSGYVAVLFVLFSILYKETKNKTAYTIFILTYFLFLMLGELFVLLGTIYFFINAAYYKEKRYFIFFMLSLGLFILQVLYRDWFFIPTNWNMFDVGVTSLGFFLNPQEHIEYLCSIPLATLCRYLSVLLSLSLIFLFLIVHSKKINMLIIGLFIIGLMKCGVGYILHDTDISSWHNFPGIIMMTGALVLQITEHARFRKVNNVFYMPILVLFLLFFLLIDIPCLTNRAQDVAQTKNYVNQRRECLVNIVKTIDPRKLSIIPDYARFESTLNHYSRFVMYEYASDLRVPPPFVDYILVPVEESEHVYAMPQNLATSFLDINQLSTISDDFTLIDQNIYYLLYKRTKISEAALAKRRSFFDLLGLSDI